MNGKEDVFLEEARLGKRTQVLVDCEEIPHIPRLVRRFREYTLVDLAHAVMLMETGILNEERGAKEGRRNKRRKHKPTRLWHISQTTHKGSKGRHFTGPHGSAPS